MEIVDNNLTHGYFHLHVCSRQNLGQTGLQTDTQSDMFRWVPHLKIANVNIIYYSWYESIFSFILYVFIFLMFLLSLGDDYNGEHRVTFNIST